jgi:hypothetical protein
MSKVFAHAVPRVACVAGPVRSCVDTDVLSLPIQTAAVSIFTIESLFHHEVAAQRSPRVRR